MVSKVFRIHRVGSLKLSCRDIRCAAYAGGFRLPVNEATALGAAQAGYIRHRSGRKFKEYAEAGLTVFVFPKGEECFADHRQAFANFQRRQQDQGFERVEFDRFAGEWNEAVDRINRG